MFARLSSLWRHFRHRTRTEGELDDELRFHVEECAEDPVRSGLSAEEARRFQRAAGVLAKDSWLHVC